MVRTQKTQKNESEEEEKKEETSKKSDKKEPPKKPTKAVCVNEWINKEKKVINKELFQKHFKMQMPSDMLKAF